MKVIYKGRDTLVSGVSPFSLKQTLDCGQCFRWDELEENTFVGVVGNTVCKIQQIDGEVTFFDTDKQTFEKVWKNYFDFDLDYNKIREEICKDDIMKRAGNYASGIRILKQDAWETICSFIISQNNNIKRIKGIVKRLCDTFGDPIIEGYNTFPDYNRIAKLSIEDLAPLRSGFRAKYILDAAQKISNGEVDLERVANSSYDDAKAELMKICGIGNKVADCALLYGFYRLEAFPEDVWIKRAMARLYPDGLPENCKRYAGIAQQYIFHYARTSEEF